MTTAVSDDLLALVKERADEYLGSSDAAEQARILVKRLTTGPYRSEGYATRAEALVGAEIATKAARQAETACRRLKAELDDAVAALHPMEDARSVRMYRSVYLSSARSRVGGAHKPPEGKRTH